MPFYRYSRWDGTQQVFPIHEEELMEQLSEQMVTQGDITAALRSMAQNGLRSKLGDKVSGVQDMLQRLEDMRQRSLDRYNLDHVLDNITQRLQDIVQAERRGIEKRLADAHDRLTSLSTPPSVPPMPTREESEALLRRLEEIARRSRETLDNVPEHPAQAIRRLKEYEFMDDEARAKFDQLLKSLQQQAAESYFRNLSQALGSAAPDGFASFKNMVRELNRLMEEHLDSGGVASRSLFDRFMQKYGGLFGPSPPASVEELAEELHHQMSRMESLMKSLSPELRRELEETLDSIFRDRDLREEIARFAANLERMRPDGGSVREFLFRGQESLDLEDALQVMGQLHKMEELERQLRRTQQGHNLDSVESELVRELMGEESYQELEQLRRMAEVLEDAGYIHQVGSHLELTPKGIRKIGHRALQGIFAYIRKDRLGSHPTGSTGAGGDLLENTKKYQYGDQFHLHLQRTLMNAIQRTSGTPVRMAPEDFEVHQTEQASQAATVLMLDLSLSMVMRGNFLAAKKVALALDNLIRTQFPRDSLHIVGFSTYAREVKADRLAYLSWDEFDPYTNIQHGLITAGKLLAKSPGSTKQIIVISDGEPTAHMEGDQLFLQYPPSPRTIQETLKEVRRCTRRGIKINTFMLERSPYLVEFVDRMTRINHGRLFYTSPDKLGEYILVDYLTSRHKQIA